MLSNARINELSCKIIKVFEKLISEAFNSDFTPSVINRKLLFYFT